MTDHHEAAADLDARLYQAVTGGWAIPGPIRLRQVVAGTNNLSRFVDTPGGTVILRLYQDTADPANLRYEHTLLRLLAGAGLPFAVPWPQPARSEETFLPIDSLPGCPLVALFPLIDGVPPRTDDLAQVAAGGGALAELDAAMARVQGDLPARERRTFGDLASIHPLVPLPLAALEGLAATLEVQTRLTRLFEALLDAVPALYARLPQQPIHSDYWPSNVLMAHRHVSGVLDFEFTAPDLRAMDLAIGLGAFGGLRKSGDLAAMRAFGAAYLARSPLRLEELAALPVLFRLALAASLMHRIGRMREGLATAAAVLERADGLIAADAWLEAHGEQLVTELQREVA